LIFWELNYPSINLKKEKEKERERERRNLRSVLLPINPDHTSVLQ
jgi:hypothetical protein